MKLKYFKRSFLKNGSVYAACLRCFTIPNFSVSKFGRAKVFYLAAVIVVSGCSGDKVSIQSLGEFDVSGQIAVKEQTSLDGDVMERFSEFTDNNNDFSSAQSITNPITLGGYVNGLTTNYPESDVVFSLDRSDVFRASLLSNQTISLSAYFADDNEQATNYISVSLNLYRVNDSVPRPVVASFSIETASAQSVLVENSDDYFVEVSADSGSAPVLYVLSFSDNLSVEDSRLLTEAVKHEFKVNEAIIGLHPTSNRNKNAKTNKRSFSAVDLDGLNQQNGLLEIDKVNPAHRVVKLRSSASSNKKTLQVNGLGATQNDSVLSEKWNTLKEIERLKVELSDSNVFIEPNYLRRASLVPSDTRFGSQWNLSAISAPEAWDITTGDSGVVVAVVDSGIDLNHEDLAAKISPDSYDFISDTLISGDGNGIDSNPQDRSTTKHGSHVAGIIGAQTNNQRGIASVGFDTTILALRTLGIENEDGVSLGSDSDIAKAILYAAGVDNESGLKLSEPVDIINLSLGSAARSDTLENAINDALQAGVIVVAAAGNEGLQQSFYPAAYSGVIAVSSVTSKGELSAFSNFGSFIDVTAPGGAANDQDFDQGEQGVLSTINQTDYVQYIGTSMATPHVSGVIALMKAVNPDLTSDNVLGAIRGGVITDQLGSSLFFGGGLINAEKAVTWAQDNQSIPDALSYFPKQFSFANQDTNTSLVLSNSGGGSVVVVGITVSDDWIEVNEVNVDESNLGEYEVRVDNNSVLEEGSITIQYRINQGDIEQIVLPVLVSNTVSSTQTVGNLFVSLYTEQTFLNALETGILRSDYTVAARLSDGAYAYTFSDVEEGAYYLRASTNNDGDGFTFDKGEAVGRYPNLSLFELINVNEDLANVNFEVQFLEQNITSQGHNGLGQLE